MISTKARISPGRASARYVRTGKRWQIQNATSPTPAEIACFSIEVNALPLLTNCSTLVAEKTMARPMTSSRPALEISR
jgi:hypothetical protein